MWAKIKTPKIPCIKNYPPFPSQEKNPIQNYAQPRFLGSNQANKENTCQIFLPQKNPGIENFTPIKSSHHWGVTWNPKYLLWGFVPPQISYSKVLLTTYFITAKQIVENKAESKRPTSKKETTTNGKRTKYPLFFGNRKTRNWKTKHPQLQWKGLQWTTMG